MLYRHSRNCILEHEGSALYYLLTFPGIFCLFQYSFALAFLSPCFELAVTAQSFGDQTNHPQKISYIVD